jgi:hypothetical protein
LQNARDLDLTALTRLLETLNYDRKHIEANGDG